MVTTTEPTSPKDGEGALHKHMSGDEHSARGFHYECGLRCLWLLDLRGTENRLAIAEGEDAKILQPEEKIIYRQAKKKEGGHWFYDKNMREFVERAYGRFSSNPSVRHEFFTNQAIPSGKYGLRDVQHLNPSHKGVYESAPIQTESFCKTVRLFHERYQPEPSLMLLIVKERLRNVIDSAYPGCEARNFVMDQEIDELAGKLLMFEYGLWSRNSAVGWREIDAELGIDRLISDLYSRSMADRTLTPIDRWLTVDKGGPDDGKTRAVEAVRGGSILPRPRVEGKVWKLIDEWFVGLEKGSVKSTRKDYLVVILTGAHGTGKTWSLMRIGYELKARYNSMRVFIAAAYPPSRPFEFGNLAISQPSPCAILIDDIFPEWSSLVSCITSPAPLPLLFLGTAAQPADDRQVRELTERLGRRVKVVSLPDHLDVTEAEGLAKARGVSLSLTEMSRVKATNIRHAAQLLSGISATEHMSAILELLSNSETLDLLGPIMMCTNLGVAVPKELLERSVGRSLPPSLQPWVLGHRGAGMEFLSLEDPDEAAGLLAETLGSAKTQRMQDWCERLLQHIDPEQVAERSFTRRLFVQLARKAPDACQHLIASCCSELSPVITREPLWAVFLSWLPILARCGHEELLTPALKKVKTAPATGMEIAILVAAYGTSLARGHLRAWFAKLVQWDPVLISRFVEAVIALPKFERRDIAQRLTSLLVDLPLDTFAKTLSQRNCFTESSSLASDFGRADDRKIFLFRVTELISIHLESGGTPNLNWFDASVLLMKRVITQKRFRLAMAIKRNVIIRGNWRFKAEDYYKLTFAEEQSLAYQTLITLGVKLLQQDTRLRSKDSLPPLAGNLVAFAASWGNEEEWRTVAETFIDLLERLSAKEVAFDRLSGVVLPTFSGMMRGPQQCSERFLKAIMSWIPDEEKVATVETSKLLLQVLVFVTKQPWIDKPIQDGARSALLELVGHSGRGKKTSGAVIGALRVAMKMPTFSAQQVRMREGWINNYSLANTYINQVSWIRWEEQERMTVGKQLINTWENMVASKMYLTEALLRLEHIVDAKRFAGEVAKDDPTFPDPLGYLAIISAKEGDAGKARDYLIKAQVVQDMHRRGVHPRIAHWIHRELARMFGGRIKTMHLLCAELSRFGPLRPYDEIVNEISE